jgi:FKBP-type peptidyl-prolyl cis-trans isomerase 2
MAEKVKSGDFVELDFVGRIKSTGQIFDLTVEDIAKKEGLNSENMTPLIACINAGHLLKGFDENLIDKTVGSEFEFDVSPEKAFGKKNPKHIQLTSIHTLKKSGVNPVTGMQLNVDGVLATVRSVSGGRVILDFNHPLAGKELHYWVKIRKLITDSEEKVNSILYMLGVPGKASVKNKVAEIKLDEEAPADKKKFVSEEIKKIIPEVEVKFI